MHCAHSQRPLSSESCMNVTKTLISIYLFIYFCSGTTDVDSHDEKKEKNKRYAKILILFIHSLHQFTDQPHQPHAARMHIVCLFFSRNLCSGNCNDFFSRSYKIIPCKKATRNRTKTKQKIATEKRRIHNFVQWRRMAHMQCDGVAYAKICASACCVSGR